jgi:hypothetical protein
MVYDDVSDHRLHSFAHKPLSHFHEGWGIGLTSVYSSILKLSPGSIGRTDRTP